MTARGFDPLRLDVAAFARDAGRLDGRWPLRQFERVAQAAHPDTPPAEADEVAWHARGERRLPRGGEPQPWLHLQAEARLSLQCQRCLGPVPVALDVRRSFLFVADEDAAALADADSEHDVLALTRALDLRELVEDELVLALPLVPRHEVCQVPLPLTENPEEPQHEEPNPFAALAVLKRGGSLN
jgi:uncharacterized protein